MTYTQRDIDIFNHACDWLHSIGETHVTKYPRANGKTIVEAQKKAITENELRAVIKGYKVDGMNTPKLSHVLICTVIGFIGLSVMGLYVAKISTPKTYKTSALPYVELAYRDVK